MLRKFSAFIGLAGLLALFATPALANHIDTASVSLTCKQFTIKVTASALKPGVQYNIPYTYTLTSTTGGPPLNIDAEIFNVMGDSNGNFSGSQTIGVSLTDNFTIPSPSGQASLQLASTGHIENTIQITFSPTTLNCKAPPTPQINTATVNPGCNSVTYNVSASGLTPGQSDTISCTISGYPTTISDSISFTAPASGTFNSGPVVQMIGPFTGNFTFSGSCTLVGENTIPITFSPTSISCPKPPPTCPGAHSSLINNLGTAGPSNCAVLSLGGSGAVVNLNLATVTGNVCVPNNGTFKESKPSTVTGSLVVGSAVNTNGAMGSHGPVVVNDSLLAEEVQDANKAAAFFAGLAVTPSVQSQFPANGQITTNLTVTGTPGLNVVNLPSFGVMNGNLTLCGPTGTAFVINDSGDFNLHKGNIQVCSTVGPLDVVYNITNPHANVTTMVPTTAVGILLAPNNTINSEDSSRFTGEVIGGFEKTIVLMSGTKMTNPCQQ